MRVTVLLLFARILGFAFYFQIFEWYFIFLNLLFSLLVRVNYVLYQLFVFLLTKSNLINVNISSAFVFQILNNYAMKNLAWQWRAWKWKWEERKKEVMAVCKYLITYPTQKESLSVSGIFFFLRKKRTTSRWTAVSFSSSFPLVSCVHMCGMRVHIDTRVWVHVCAHVCGHPRLISAVFLNHSPLCSLRQGLSVEPRTY